MSARSLSLTLLAESLAIARLPAEAALPEWAGGAALLSLTRTGDELSIVCAAAAVPADVRQSAPWRGLRLDGALDLEAVGILAAVLAPLATAGVSIFALSTYDTDYVLVREEQLATALAALRRAGHAVAHADGT